MPIRHRSIKQVRRDRLKGFMDRRIVQAIGHPVREHILAVLNERTASPTEIGDELGLDVAAFYKHVQILEELGCIECVESRPVRGFNERFFRARATLLFDDAAWRRVPATLRRDICCDLLQAISDDAAAALRSGRLGRGEPEHVSWTTGVVDARGRAEIVELLDATLDRLIEVQRESAERLAGESESGTPVTFALLGFEADPTASKAAVSRGPGPVRWRRRRPASVRSAGR